MYSVNALLAAGSNAHGQLANGTVDDSDRFHPCSFFGYIPETLPTNTRRVLNLATGANHTVVLLERSDGSKETGTYTELWGSGDGGRGQLGPTVAASSPGASGSPPRIFQPIQLFLEAHGLHDYAYRMVAASWETTYIVLSSPGKNDCIISMGADDFGDLGIGHPQDRERTAASPFHIIDLDPLTNKSSSPIRVEFIETGPHNVVVRVSSTDLPNGLVFGWGTSRHGQLGSVVSPNGRPVPFVSKPITLDLGADGVAAASAVGSQHAVFLFDSGRLLGMGSPRKGQLDGLDTLTNVKSVSCSWNTTYATVESGHGCQIFASGSHSRGQLGRRLTALPNEKTSHGLAAVEFPFAFSSRRLLQLACGSEHVLALFAVSDPNGEDTTEVWGWGWNEHGNLGIGTTADVELPLELWPGASPHDRSARAAGVWAGCGTSWIVTHARTVDAIH
ncbi:hypothetical protein PLICRDRAFT_36478 [Plicaturopsis crispa FD-325 SS-3]|nr:hypothetical protein PLICRDRAFT_36478 [Plicaturopsis crispa FD-325 SS-3]